MVRWLGRGGVVLCYVRFNVMVHTGRSVGGGQNVNDVCAFVRLGYRAGLKWEIGVRRPAALVSVLTLVEDGCLAAITVRGSNFTLVTIPISMPIASHESHFGADCVPRVAPRREGVFDGCCHHVNFDASTAGWFIPEASCMLQSPFLAHRSGSCTCVAQPPPGRVHRRGGYAERALM
ncbi:hypothetical protein BC834DRAFT_144959 [Gloeopeniophorella convolvens]|nr:hypothetical protein BC834DRAFT_144959 [Gloeopeniophorella convolvens]